MITLTDTAVDVLAGQQFQVFARLESWLGGQLLTDDIPIYDASETQDATLRVPERLTFRTPAVVDDVSWVPTSFDSALGCYGQRVRVSLGLGVQDGHIEWINRGWFLIYAAEQDGETVAVEALGLLSLVDEATLPTEYQPRSGATLGAIVRALVEPGLTVNTDAAPSDRAAPSAITYSDNRLDSVLAILDAWPAEARVTADGFLAIVPVPADPVSGDVVLELTDGTGGTVLTSSTVITRDGAFNAVVAKGQYPDTDPTKPGQEIIVTVQDSDSASPYRASGPFSPYLVPYGYASPLLTTPAQVRSAALTRLRTLRRQASRTVQITAVPHPGIELGDVVRVTSERLAIDGVLGTVDAFTLPYIAGGGPMLLTVRLED